MAGGEGAHKRFLEGLHALVKDSFPKRCAACGRVFETAELFLSQTKDIDAFRSGLKEAEEDGMTFVEVFRNCPCGSTLMDYFSDRRDESQAGRNRRSRFEKLLDDLEAMGITRDTGRAELLNVMRGGKSELLASIYPVQKTER